MRVIVSECNSANCFSVIADETTDVSTTEQIALCVRYVGVDSDEEMCVKESFLGFAEASSTTGEELATTPYLTIGSLTNLLFFFVHQEHLIALHLPVVTWF
jgi:hypothetical protein